MITSACPQAGSSGSSGMTLLQCAAAEGDIPMIKKVFELGARIDSSAGDKGNALYYATLSGNPTVVELMLKMGVKVDDSIRGHSILVQAIRNGLYSQVRRLISLGTYVNVHEEGESPLSAALRAGQEYLVGLLRYHGAIFSDMDYEVAKEAIENGSLEELRTLLEYGLDPNMCKHYHNPRPVFEFSPIYYASQHTDNAAIKLLVDYGADLGRGQFADVLDEICRRGNAEMAMFFLDHGASVHLDQALAAAVELKGNEAMVESMLDRGAMPKASTMCSAASTGDKYMIARLLEVVTIPEDRKECLGVLLQEAAWWANLDLCTWLIGKYGADVNHYGGRLGSPLRAAVSSMTGGLRREPVVDLLLKHGAQVNPPEAPRRTDWYRCQAMRRQYAHRQKRDMALTCPSPLYLGLPKYSHSVDDAVSITRKLLDLGADPNLCGGDLHTPLQNAAVHCPVMLGPLLDEGADVNIIGGRMGTALHAAASRNDIDSIKLLLSHGADARIVAGRYGTVLQAAALFKAPEENGNSNIDEQAATNEVMDTLLRAGADPHRDNTGKYGSAVQTAAVKGNLFALKWLAATGANIRAKGGVWGTRTAPRTSSIATGRGAPCRRTGTSSAGSRSITGETAGRIGLRGDRRFKLSMGYRPFGIRLGTLIMNILILVSFGEEKVRVS
ncbi:multiple ankyrin repeats single kh domain-containing protein [Apiospora hydei]|uniref:Multiple ankyrin repeats single kh domain-containing protein n=1 Tax=Apiospora hydei TaxID=1337664 RepID=A0ABR1XDX9_9PEZI